jgi:hypothetical protein
LSPLEDALKGPAQAAVGSVVSSEFLDLQQKLAADSGHRIPKFPSETEALYAQIVEMAVGQNG